MQNEQAEKYLRDAIEDLEKGEAVTIECPTCGKYTFVGIGQGYTSDNRPYPVGSCCCCHMKLEALSEEDDAELMMEFRNQHWDKWVLFCLQQKVQPVVEDTKEVTLYGKRFHFEADYEGTSGVKAVRLTECGDPNETEMLETYDLYSED